MPNRMPPPLDGMGMGVPMGGMPPMPPTAPQPPSAPPPAPGGIMAPCNATDCRHNGGGVCNVLEAGMILPQAGGVCQVFEPAQLPTQAPPQEMGTTMPPSLDMLMGGMGGSGGPPIL